MSQAAATSFIHRLMLAVSQVIHSRAGRWVQRSRASAALSLHRAQRAATRCNLRDAAQPPEGGQRCATVEAKQSYGVHGMKWLIPVDGSELSFEAVAYAVRMAQAGLACELVLVNVQEPATFYELVTLHDAEAIERLAEAAGQDLLAAAEAQVRAAQLPYSTHVRMGEPVALLLEVLEEEGCDGVIMGSHGRGLLGRTLLGSVSQQMLQHAPVPVTFVKHAAQPDSEPDSEPDSDS
ncbi:MAG: hypothetical protein B7Y96_06215 [Comamonadaceae bacterium 32-67-11]|nr:MAG: hypothetical protein B7Y96_06215 [Comamonadaceae bacterium 32-67-11]